MALPSCTWFDDFSAPALGAGWSWLRPDPTHWSLSARPGSLRITTQGSDIFDSWNAAKNILLRPAPAGDFEITTRLTFNPSQNFQQAHLLIYWDDDNFVSIKRIYSSNSGGNAVEFTWEVNRVFNYQAHAESATSVYLKLAKAGSTYSGSYSLDGLAWTQVGQMPIANAATPQIGLGAWNGIGTLEIPADFDWFCLNAGPAPTATSTPTPGWQSVFADGFEGSFPGNWRRLGNPGWGRSDCRASAGTYSVWPAADGTGAVTPCTNNYPDNLNAWMIYGPFSLSDATAAQFRFKRWQRTELNYDYVNWLASVDGNSFYGWKSSGDSEGWVTTVYDLCDAPPPLGNLCGRPQVWVAFYMQSNANTTDQGVWIDEVRVRKVVGGAAGP